MRVALVNLTSGGMSGGYRKYLENMLPLLAGDVAISGLELLSPEGLRSQHVPGVEEWFWPAAGARSGYGAVRQHLRQSAPDVVFFPTARMVQSRRPTVVMVRNMEPLIAPFTGNSVRDGMRNLARRFVARSGVRRSDRVIAVSRFVRDFLVTSWGIAAEKIGVVPHGVEAPLLARRQAVPPEVEGGGNMLFAAGSIRPARGLEDAIAALGLLVADGVPARLVIAGMVTGDAKRYRLSLEEDIARRGLRDRVIWAGELSPGEMGWCFSHSTAFVMTSRVEACPNTALEALSYGALCVSTSSPPMPETFASAATYYPAGDAAALANRLLEVIRLSPGEREARSRGAEARAHEFKWETTAHETVRQLMLAAGYG